MMMRGNIRRKKKSNLSIKIKPFAKPPSIPANFYSTSSSLLWASLHSILQRCPTLTLPNSTPSPADDATSSTLHSSSSVSAADPVNAAVLFDYSGTDNENGIGGTNTMTMPMPSMEELFGKVQDLCTHGFGPKLYMELISFLDKAALTCASRLKNDMASDGASGVHSSGRAPTYPTMNCIADEGAGKVYFTDRKSVV